MIGALQVVFCKLHPGMSNCSCIIKIRKAVFSSLITLSWCGDGRTLIVVKHEILVVIVWDD